VEAGLHAFFTLAPNKNKLLASRSGILEPAIIVQYTGGSSDGVKKMNIRNVSGPAGNQTRCHGCPERGLMADQAFPAPRWPSFSLGMLFA